MSNYTHLKLGDKAPNFSLKDSDSTEISLQDFIGQNVILYFYPKDNTSGCSIEAQDFTKLLKEFENLGYVVIGISKDTPKSHQNFISKYNLKHILLCDIDNAVSQKYGIYTDKMMYGKMVKGVKRSTFVIDKEGKISHIFYDIRAKEHAKNVLEIVSK